MERKLAAILAADVVGYSRLMEHDEAKTFQRVKAHRNELVEPTIAEHRGCIFKLMGDGLLAEFGSVVDAVECAVDIQRGMAERNTGEPQDQRTGPLPTRSPNQSRCQLSREPTAGASAVPAMYPSATPAVPYSIWAEEIRPLERCERMSPTQSPIWMRLDACFRSLA